METCKSPRTVLREAYELALPLLPKPANKFSRQDGFTEPQLFACLVLREHQKKSYRGVVALLKDCPEWRADIGLPRAPGHNTLCLAFRRLVGCKMMNRMLDEQVAEAEERGLIEGRVEPAAIDSSMFESRHVSRHFETRCRQTARKAAKGKSAARKKRRGKRGKSGGSHAPAVNRRRSRTVRRLPKLSIAVATACHLIVAAKATTGSGGDQPFFEPLLLDVYRRSTVGIVVADAGYDSEANHSIGRDDLGIRTIIPPNAGRPTDKPPTTRHRRNMKNRFDRKADAKLYGQRWQVETVNSMIKRNLGSALRAKTARRRSMELLLRVVTHNIMVLCGNEG